MTTKYAAQRVRTTLMGILLIGVVLLCAFGSPILGQERPNGPLATLSPTARAQAQPAGEAVWLPLIESAPPPTATPTPSPTLTATPEPATTASATPTQQPTPTAGPTHAPLTPAPLGYEWSQFGQNAQHTSYAPEAVSLPWKWKWVWNGSTAAGDIVSGKFGLPRNSQPVTGGGRVYVAAGAHGVFALDAATGAQIWNQTPGGEINSTPAYDGPTGSLFVVSSNGNLYKLNAATGAVQGSVAGGGTSDLPLPPAVDGSRVFFSMGAHVLAVDTATLAVKWSYNAGSPVDTPPAVSSAANTVVVASHDLFAHAINATTGARLWRVKPTGRVPGATSSLGYTEAEVSNGWPVIAEGHGLVFIRYRLDWYTLWPKVWPTETNAQIRAFLLQYPDQQALFALRLDTGVVDFIPNVGNGAYADGDFMAMGSPPTIRRFDDGSEIAYVMMRGRCMTSYCDARWDARLGEMVMDATTVPEYEAGFVRYTESTFIPTDEMPFLSAAGNQVFGGHWEVGIAHEIVDRSNARGSADAPITTSNLPHIVASQDQDTLCPGFSTSHYCAARLMNTRQWPGGFYVYWKKGQVNNEYWSGYATWVISNDLMLFVGADGSVAALEHGTPAATAAVAALAAAPELPVAHADANAGSPAQLPLVAADDARAYAGQNAVVEGVLADVFNNGKAVYLGFHKPHRGYFLVRILRADWANFAAPPETLYAPGDHVQVTGVIEWYQGDPVIYVSRPEQIRTD